MKFSLLSKVLTCVAVAGLLVACYGAGRYQPEPVSGTPASEVPRDTVARNLTRGGIAVVWLCLIPVAIERIRQGKAKAATGVA